MRNKRTRYLTMTFGCLLVIVIVCAQFFSQAHAQQQVKKSVTAEQTDDTSGEVCISLPSFSLPTPIHVQINLDSHCLFEILFEDIRDSGSSTPVSESAQKLFVTLFQVIISPNAP
jgi:hypothetical protein